MKTQIDLNEAVGKTIESVHYGDDTAVVHFTDGMCAPISIDNEKCLTFSSISSPERDSINIALGLISQQEYDEASKKTQESVMKAKREQFERLKKEFGE